MFAKSRLFVGSMLLSLATALGLGLAADRWDLAKELGLDTLGSPVPSKEDTRLAEDMFAELQQQQLQCRREFKSQLALARSLAESHYDLETRAAAAQALANEETLQLAAWMERLTNDEVLPDHAEWEQSFVVERNQRTGQLRAIRRAAP